MRVLGNVLHRLPAKLLPSINPPQLLADTFVEFFKNLTEKIRSTFPASLSSQHITPDHPRPMFSTFSTVFKNSIRNARTPQPREIFLTLGELFWGKLKYLVTNALNACFQKGKLSTTLRQCIVTLLPKGNKDRSQLKNWWPISLLSVVYKQRD